jgi:hypothetical protein
MQQELDRLKAEFAKMSAAGGGGQATTDMTSNDLDHQLVEKVKSRRNSIIAAKRHSVIRLLSESEPPMSPEVTEVTEEEVVNEAVDEEEEASGDESVVKPAHGGLDFFELFLDSL